MTVFICGCCGLRFSSTRYEQAKFDQDKGFGICLSCEKEMNEGNEKLWKIITEEFVNSLSKRNRKKFYTYSINIQRSIILKAIDDDIIQFII